MINAKEIREKMKNNKDVSKHMSQIMDLIEEESSKLKPSCNYYINDIEYAEYDNNDLIRIIEKNLEELGYYVVTTWDKFTYKHELYISWDQEPLDQE